jgi:Kdo2-lipid IVA lauroyltransferase/acyltransferase
MAEKLADFLAFLIGNVFRYRRKTILNNLHMVYGENLPANKKILLRNIYRNFTYLWFEVMHTKKITPENFNDHFIVHGFEIFEQLIQRNKGLILISGHFGNFEWTPIILGIKGYFYTAIAKRQRNPYVNKFITESREFFGGKIIFVKKALKEGLNVLRKKKLLLLVGDQDARKKGVFVDFLGIPSSTAVGTAVFHLRTGAPILFIALIRKSYAHFEVFFEEIKAPENLKYSEESIIEITQIHTRVLEKWIRKYPEQWFWMHRRWKSKPEDAN